MHGGNIYRLAEQLGTGEEKIVDFSASINPLGVPKSVEREIKKHLASLHNYPDPETKRLREKISEHYGVDPETVICGNGSTELIYLIPRALKPGRVLIPQPTFSEYERACMAGEASIKHFMLKRKDGFKLNPSEFISAIKGMDMAFLCNPNNPTGDILKKDSVLEIAEAAKRHKCVLVVDEAFMDFCPEESVISRVKDNPYLIVLRSMTKFYALSGLRIGFGVFPSRLVRKLKAYKEPWTVNSLAEQAAITAIDDEAFKEKTLALIPKEKQFLEGQFKKFGIRFYPSSANFYLLEIKNAKKLIDRLLERHIAVRDCSDFKGLGSSHIRVAVKRRRENKMLIRELSDE